jgi:hypothetical protein
MDIPVITFALSLIISYFVITQIYPAPKLKYPQDLQFYILDNIKYIFRTILLMPIVYVVLTIILIKFLGEENYYNPNTIATVLKELYRSFMSNKYRHITN